MVRLQKDIDDYRKELELTRNQTPAVAPRPPGRAVEVHANASSKVLREVELGAIPYGV